VMAVMKKQAMKYGGRGTVVSPAGRWRQHRVRGGGLLEMVDGGDDFGHRGSSGRRWTGDEPVAVGLVVSWCRSDRECHMQRASMTGGAVGRSFY
jgi:hypothetical protein